MFPLVYAPAISFGTVYCFICGRRRSLLHDTGWFALSCLLISQSTLMSILHCWCHSHYICWLSFIHVCIWNSIWENTEKQNRESTEGYSRWKVVKRHDKIEKTCLNNWGIRKSQKGDGTRCQLLTCQTSCKCSMETNRIRWRSSSVSSISYLVDFGWFVAFVEHQNFPCSKLIEGIILWVYYTIPFGFSLFWHFLVITLQVFILHVWLRITDEGSVREMCIWSISLIYSD